MQDSKKNKAQLISEIKELRELLEQKTRKQKRLKTEDEQKFEYYSYETEVPFLQSEETYRNLFYNSPLGIYRTTPGGRILAANPALIKMLAYESFEELAGRNLETDGYANLSAPRDRFKKLLEERGELIGYENEWLRKDGKTIYVRENAKLIKKDDKTVFYEGTIEDITEKTLAERALKESEERFKILFEGNPDPVMLANPCTGQIIDANKSTCKLLKYDIMQIIGKYVSDLSSPEKKDISLNSFFKRVKSAETGNKISPFEVTLLSSDNKAIPFEVSVQLITVDGTKVLYGVFRDISERKSIEKALIESEENYRLIFQSSMDGILLTSPNGDIYHSNPAATEILGWSGEEICRLGRKGILDTTDPNLGIALEERNITGKFFTELKAKRKDGAIIPVEASGKLFRLKDGSIRSCIIIRDITEKKKARAILTDAIEFNNKIFESSPIGKAVYNSTGQCISANENFCKIIGAAKEQVLLQNFHGLDSWKKYGLYAIADEVLTYGGPIHKEIHMVTTFGKEIWMELNAVRFYSKGEPHLLIMNNDITERKKAEETLKLSEALTKSILDSLTSHVAVVHQSGHIVAVNKAWSSFARLNDAGSDLGIGTNYLDACLKASAEVEEARQALEGINQVLNGSMEQFSLEYSCHSPSERRWFLMNVTPLNDGYATISHTDITMNKLAEEAISISEKRFRALIQNSSDVIMLLDSNGIIQYISPSVTNLIEYLPEEMLGKIAFNWVHHDDLPGIHEALGQLLANPAKEFKTQLRILHKNETYSWIEAMAINLFDEPAAKAIVINYRDIDERKTAELKLSESEERFRTSVENMLDSFAIFEAKRNEKGEIEDFIYKYINEAGCRNNMMKREDLLGRGMLEILPMHKDTGLFYEYCQIVETGEPLLKDSLFYEDNYAGKYLSRAFEISAVRLGDGFAVAWRDISVRKKAEAAQRISESRYRALGSNFPNGAVILFDEELRYFLVEGTEISKVGLSKEYMEGKTIYEMFAEDVCDKLAPHYKATFQGQENVFEVNTPNNIYEVHTIPVKSDFGDIIAGMAMVQNISERKKTEKQLKELVESKDKLFSIIAHDLRSPFTSLIGFSEFLVNDFDELSGEEVKSFATNIHKSAQNVFNLLENLLQWSRLQTGRMDFTPVQFNIKELLEKNLDIYQFNAVKKNINIGIKACKDIKVFADKYMIDTAIRNILSNAIKFTNNGGEVIMQAVVHGNFAHISIRDNGIGISKDNLTRLFSLGDRVTTLGTKNEKGTGLGLVLCKEFIEINNGELIIESQVGKGTCFTFVLPIK